MCKKHYVSIEGLYDCDEPNLLQSVDHLSTRDNDKTKILFKKQISLEGLRNIVKYDIKLKEED